MVDADVKPTRRRSTSRKSCRTFEARRMSRSGSGTFREPSTRNEAVAFEVLCRDDLTTDYVFEPDFAGSTARANGGIVPAPHTPADPLADDMRPRDAAIRRTWTDGEKVDSRGSSSGRAHHRTAARLHRHQEDPPWVLITGEPSTVLWHLVSLMDGAGTVAQILSSLPEGQRAE